MARPMRQTRLMQTKMHLESPPYRKVRALRLFDTPATPKTLLQKAALENLTATPDPHKKLVRKSILSHIGGLAPQTPNISDRPKPLPVHSKGTLTANINPFSPSSKTHSADYMPRNRMLCKGKLIFCCFRILGFIQKKKRSRTEEPPCRSSRVSTESLVSKSNLSFSSMDGDISGENTTDDEWQAPKRLALQDSNLPRYEKEFLELSLIGMYGIKIATKQ